MYPNYQPQINPYQYPFAGYYTPSYPQMQTQQSQTVATPQLKLDTVSGKTAADVYNVNIGEEAILIDIDNPCIYRKSRGVDNKLDFKTYDLILREDKPEVSVSQIDMNEYIKRSDIDSIIDTLVKAEVDKRLSEISFAPRTTTKKTKVVDE